MKPICYDLFCGFLLGKSQLCGRADSPIEQPMTGWTQNPDHMPLTVLHFATSIHAAKFWPMSNFDDSRFSAGFTRLGKIGILAIKALHNCAASGAPRIVDGLYVRLAMVKSSTLLFASLLCARFRAVSTVRRWQDDFEVRTAHLAVAASTGNIGLLSAPKSPRTARALLRAIELIWPLRLEATLAMNA